MLNGSPATVKSRSQTSRGWSPQVDAHRGSTWRGHHRPRGSDQADSPGPEPHPYTLRMEPGVDRLVIEGLGNPLVSVESANATSFRSP